MSIREWQNAFIEGKFDSNDIGTQCEAGWWDWFCKDSSLASKTKRMGQIIKKVKDGGKVDLDNLYVWFENNCSCFGPLYDDFGFARLVDGEVKFTIEINCCHNNSRYTVYGERNGINSLLFESNSSRDLVKWLNSAW